MILVPTRILPSPIHGLGLFAVQVIPKGTMVWRYQDPPDFHVHLLSDGRLPSFWLGHRKYGYREAGKDYVEFPGDASMFINHSSRPNIVAAADGKMFAARDISIDEEILADYREFESDPAELEGLLG